MHNQDEEENPHFWGPFSMPLLDATSEKLGAVHYMAESANWSLQTGAYRQNKCPAKTCGCRCVAWNLRRGA